MTTISEVNKYISEAKIPEKWKTKIFEAYCLGYKTVTLYGLRNWYEKYGERCLTRLYRHTGFKNNTVAVFEERYTGMELIGYKITIYFE